MARLLLACWVACLVCTEARAQGWDGGTPETAADAGPERCSLELSSPPELQDGGMLHLQGSVGLERFHRQFTITPHGSCTSLDFEQPFYLERKRDGGASAQLRVAIKRTRKVLAADVAEPIEVEVLDVTEEGTYEGSLSAIPNGEHKRRMSIRLKVTAERPKGFQMGAVEYNLTRCSACWLKDLMVTGDTPSTQWVHLTPLPTTTSNAVLRRSEQLQVSVSQAASPDKGADGGTSAGGVSEGEPNKEDVDGAPSLAALGWPSVRRRGANAYLLLNLDPNALPPGKYTGHLHFLLPNGEILSDPEDSNQTPRVTLHVRQGPGVLLGLWLASLAPLLLGVLAYFRVSLHNRLHKKINHSLSAKSKEEDRFTKGVQDEYKKDITRLGQRLSLTPHRQQLLLLHTLEQTLEQLRQLQDTIHAWDVPQSSTSLKARTVALLESTCQGLRIESEPALVARAIESLRMSVASLARQADPSDPDKPQSMDLAFVVARLQVIASSARLRGRTLPVPRLPPTAGGTSLLVSSLLAGALFGLLGLFTCYLDNETFGRSFADYSKALMISMGSTALGWLLPYGLWRCIQRGSHYLTTLMNIKPGGAGSDSEGTNPDHEPGDLDPQLQHINQVADGQERGHG